MEIYCFKLFKLFFFFFLLPLRLSCSTCPRGIAEDGQASQSRPPGQAREQICGTDGFTYTNECGICAYNVSVRRKEHAFRVTVPWPLPVLFQFILPFSISTCCLCLGGNREDLAEKRKELEKIAGVEIQMVQHIQMA